MRNLSFLTSPFIPQSAPLATVGLALKSFATFEKVADGKSTKILIPSEIQNLAGFMQAIKEIK